MPLAGTENPTQPCDEVHLGGVEFFNEGQWGRLCVAGRRPLNTWTVDAIVACRQLGFPFGSLMDNADNGFFDADSTTPGSERPTWATIVLCKGTEERLDECSFIEDFGRAGTEIAGRPTLSDISCFDGRVFSVICRRFPMEGVSSSFLLDVCRASLQQSLPVVLHESTGRVTLCALGLTCQWPWGFPLMTVISC